MIKKHPLKLYLMSVGMSQTELAEKTGMSRSKINLFLNGRCNLDMKETELVCKALGLEKLDCTDSQKDYVEFMKAIGEIKG